MLPILILDDEDFLKIEDGIGSGFGSGCVGVAGFAFGCGPGSGDGDGSGFGYGACGWIYDDGVGASGSGECSYGRRWNG